MYANFCVLIGRVVRRPSLRVTQGGSTVCTLFLKQVFKHRVVGEGETHYRTTYVPLTCWGKLAAFVCSALKPQMPIYVRGYITVAVKHRGTVRIFEQSIVAQDVQVLGAPRRKRGEGDVGVPAAGVAGAEVQGDTGDSSGPGELVDTVAAEGGAGAFLAIPAVDGGESFGGSASGVEDGASGEGVGFDWPAFGAPVAGEGGAASDDGGGSSESGEGGVDGGESVAVSGDSGGGRVDVDQEGRRDDDFVAGVPEGEADDQSGADHGAGTAPGAEDAGDADGLQGRVDGEGRGSDLEGREK